MELGNLIFGNPCGNYVIERHIGWEEELLRLFKVCNKEDASDFDLGYGLDFENDVFHIFPYYWGDCNCGFDHKEGQWWEVNKHTKSCFYTKRDIWEKDWKKSGRKTYGNPKYIDELDKFAKVNGHTGWEGSASHCDCGLHERYDEWSNHESHDSNCPIIRPNFLYKPSGLTINWYKYILRDNYISHEISFDGFKKIIDDCIESIPKMKHKTFWEQ